MERVYQNHGYASDVIVLLLSCAGPLRAEFEQQKALGLAEPTPVAEGWAPDAALRLSRPVVEAILAASLEKALTDAEPFDAGVAWLEPDLEVERVALVAAGCESCVGLAGRVGGELVARNRLGSTSYPVQVDFRGDCTVLSEPTDEGLLLSVQVVEVRRMQVDLGADWISVDMAELLTGLPPVELGRVGGSTLPLAALRVAQEPSGARVELAIETAHPGAIRSWSEGPEQGFEVLLHEQTLLDRARRAAWQRGARRLEIQPELRALDFEGDTFELQVRLWRIQPRRSWWRDVLVEGVVLIQDGALKLEPTATIQVDKSPGAGFVDPLSTAIRGPMLKTIEASARQAIPLVEDIDAEALQLSVQLDEAVGEGDRLVLRGRAELR